LLDPTIQSYIGVYNVFRPAFQKSWSRTVALTDQKEDTRSFLAVVTYYTGQAF